MIRARTAGAGCSALAALELEARDPHQLGPRVVRELRLLEQQADSVEDDVGDGVGEAQAVAARVDARLQLRHLGQRQPARRLLVQLLYAAAAPDVIVGGRRRPLLLLPVGTGEADRRRRGEAMRHLCRGGSGSMDSFWVG